jgi:hypothetical protein
VSRADPTRAGNPHEAGGDPAVLSNTPPPLPLAGTSSKRWADVFLPTSLNRRKDRCRLLQSAIASWSLCAAVSTKPSTVWPGEPPERPGLLILAAVCAFERELTDSANIAELAPTASQAGLPPTLRPGHARCQPNWAPFCAPFTASLGHPI